MLDINRPIKVSILGHQYDARVIATDRHDERGENIVVLARDEHEELVVVCNEDGLGYCLSDDEDALVRNVEIV